MKIHPAIIAVVLLAVGFWSGYETAFYVIGQRFQNAAKALPAAMGKAFQASQDKRRRAKEEQDAETVKASEAAKRKATPEQAAAEAKAINAEIQRAKSKVKAKQDD